MNVKYVSFVVEFKLIRMYNMTTGEKVYLLGYMDKMRVINVNDNLTEHLSHLSQLMCHACHLVTNIINLILFYYAGKLLLADLTREQRIFSLRNSAAKDNASEHISGIYKVKSHDVATTILRFMSRFQLHSVL